MMIELGAAISVVVALYLGWLLRGAYESYKRGKKV